MYMNTQTAGVHYLKTIFCVSKLTVKLHQSQMSQECTDPFSVGTHPHSKAPYPLEM